LAWPLGWSPQLAMAVVGLINGFGGNFTLGGCLSTNVLLVRPEIAPWSPQPNQNVISQCTGNMNALRNGLMASINIWRFMTQDKPATFPYRIGVTSGTWSISGTDLTIPTAPTGNIKLFQRVTDAQNFTTNALTDLGGTVLHFASTTGIAAGMHVTNLTHPRSIAGNIRVASTTSTTVTLTPSTGVGFSGSFDPTHQVSPRVESGDVIAFGMVARGTKISGLGTCGATPSYPCTYNVSVSQTVTSEAMTSHGGWPADGIYIDVAGTAGTSNYVQCDPAKDQSAWTVGAIKCNVVGSLDDVVIRFPVAYQDARRLNCNNAFLGTIPDCVSTDILGSLPITFQLQLTYSANVSSVPTLNTKIACPLIGISQSGANTCYDSWTNASYDIEPVTLSACNSGAPTPTTCTYSYIWQPTGIVGGMEIEYHTNALTDTQSFIIDGFELKQTPGATCNGSAPPCIQLYPTPIELPDLVTDLQRNMRFTQTIGSGWQVGINSGNRGFVETTSALAFSTTAVSSHRGRYR
jgi:hypothetical protein